MRTITAILVSALVGFTARVYAQTVPPPSGGSGLQAVLVGGGPVPSLNQAAIESNIRYLGHLLPSTANVTTLYANGNPSSQIVLAEPSQTKHDKAVLLYESIRNDVIVDPSPVMRTPHLPRGINGAATSSTLLTVLQSLGDKYRAGRVNGPLLLYFTGHGGPGGPNFSNNFFAMWRPSPPLAVTDLARDLRSIPKSVPVYVVMVQCYSGGFANLLLKGGSAAGQVTSRPIAGFFASTRRTEAAGCTAAVDEKNYPDFTSYFFAALTGRNRVGQQVTGADYRKDGKITLAEAYDYAIANDPTIDIPTCTSDLFLRQFVPARDDDIFLEPRILVKSWATPGQVAALNSLEKQIGFRGKQPVYALYEKMTESSSASMPVVGLRRAGERFDQLARGEFRDLLHKFPGLTSRRNSVRRPAKAKAISWIERNYNSAHMQSLLKASRAGDKLQEQAAVQFALRLRYLRLFKSVYLAHKLMQTGTPDLQARFAELMKAEDSTLLPPATAWTEP